jgi:hypothetical protein
MLKSDFLNLTLAGLAALSLTACENLPGSKGTQGAVLGGAGGAAVGAAVGGHEHRALGALLGGALGAAGGYVVGANSDRIMGHDQKSAQDAVRNSQEHPATPQEAMGAPTADINGDGFVTLDEVVAMRDAGFSDAQMIDRMRATGQIFELTPSQRQYLLDHGVSANVVDQMDSINQEARNRILQAQPAYTPQPVPTAVPPATTYPGTMTAPPTYPQTTVPPVTPYPGPATIPQGLPPEANTVPPVVSQPPASTPQP